MVEDSVDTVGYQCSHSALEMPKINRMFEY